MSDYTPSLDNLSLQYALSKDPGNGRTTEEWWAIRDAAQAEFDRAIAKVRTEAKAEALREAADALPIGWGRLVWLNRDTGRVGEGNPGAWLRKRADNLEAS